MSDTSAVLSLLTRSGPLRTAQLRSILGMSSSALSRMRDDLSDRVLITGKARATTWSVRRSILGLITPVRVYEIDAVGDAVHVLTLHPIEPMGGYVEAHTKRASSGFYETDPSDLGHDPNIDLPWFLHDLKPVGFLGRGWLSRFSGLDFPRILSQWSGDDVLRFAAQFGQDAPGALVIGAAAAARRSAPPVMDLSCDTTLLDAVERSQAVSVDLSSLGGEQPKFLARVDAFGEQTDVVVKFSPPMGTALGRRWADLLMAEHIAHQIIADSGLSACQSLIRDAGDRRFLVVRRFDRVGVHGRSGVHTLLPLDRNGAASDMRSWSILTRRLVDDGRLLKEAHHHARWAESFGHAIANTDMHLGNLAFTLDGTHITGLAPIYDMLPMFYAPRHNELVPGLYACAEDVPATVREAARVFWSRVAACDAVSDDFQTIARHHAGL